MLLKSLKLENIRSYISQEIKFPTGIVLLSGDIGSGKSTILLSIEFALFGILPGELTGSSLLRNGESKGSVELNFEINNQNVIIYRTLKRSKTSVGQGNGYIVKNNVKIELTPVELKTQIFLLLGYPKEMLAKSRNIYRFTVYTPQEDMKRILQERKEDRLDILRKVFDIDKYKRVQDNTVSYIRTIKEEQKEKAGMTADLEEKKKNRRYRQRDFNLAEKKIQDIKPLVNAAKIKVEHKKKIIEETEERQKKLQELKKSLAVKETEIQNKTEQHNFNLKQTKELEKEIKKLQKELDGEEIKETSSEEIQEINKKIISLEKEIRALNEKKTIHETDKKRSQELKQKINELDNCPTCLQIVDETHKSNISSKENEKIQTSTLHINKYFQEAVEKEKELETNKTKAENLRDQEKKMAELRIKKTNLEDKEKKYEKSIELQEKLLKTIEEAKTKKQEISQETKKYLGTEKEIEADKKELAFLQDEEKNQEIEYNRAVEKKENMKSIIEELDKEIDKKEKIKNQLLKLQDLKTWLTDYFLKLTEAIEKQVMTRVYYEFNELLQAWFSALVEDEAIQIRLDDTFTPLIVQNGYDIDIDNLSGGEKTACALAYRLALNKVINDLITDINTKELLILDEPTDGFSSEQLDQMRTVLEQLGMKQIIIVSHENKVETFVDEVIKVNKSEHVSQLAS
ncbi:AAA family ATPase [Candidatus Woesearchaeota archaeon]|nr:AAA family ATPase [Candidatus Woesearchaeota archaeon]